MDGTLLLHRALMLKRFSTPINIYSVSMGGLYVHIPFCKRICGYCDFVTVAGSARLFNEYVDLLLREAEMRMPFGNSGEKPFSTAYFGGGTPSALPVPEFSRLVRGLESLGIDFARLDEVDFECNPDSASPEILENARSLGVNRFSLGLQTFDDALLASIGRLGSAEENREALLRVVDFAKKTGGRASADLMFWLPGQTLERFESDVAELARSGIGHVSFYGLSVGANTVLGKRLSNGKISLDDDLYPRMYEAGVRILESFGIERYEVSNFARAGEESLHNRNYWLSGTYLGLGPGAHGFDGRVRTAAPARYADWKRWVEASCPDAGLVKDPIGERERAEEKIWLSLRMREGLDLQVLESEGLPKISGQKIERWVSRGFLSRDGSRIKLCGRGWIMMDSVVADLLPD